MTLTPESNLNTESTQRRLRAPQATGKRPRGLGPASRHRWIIRTDAQQV
jgi:hypothetical protein